MNQSYSLLETLGGIMCCAFGRLCGLRIGLVFCFSFLPGVLLSQDLPSSEPETESVSEPAHQLDVDAFHKQWEALPGPVHRGEGILKKAGEHLIFDIGDQKQNAIVKLMASVRSQIETPLRLRLTPSCNCTLGVPDRVDLLPGKVWDVKTLIRLPPVARDFSTVIRCFDPDVGFEFDVAIVGKVQGNFRSEPSLLRVKDGSHEFEVQLRPNFSDLRLTEVTLKCDCAELVRSTIADDGSATLRVFITSPEDRLIADRDCILYYKTASDGDNVYEFVLPVVFIERLQVKPSRGVFRKRQGSEKYTAAFQLSGGEVDWKLFATDQFAVFVCEEDSKNRTELNVSKCMIHEHGAIVFVESDRSQLERYFSPRIRFEGKPSSWSVEVPFLILE